MKRQILLSVAVTSGLLLGGTATTTYAAKWHTGIPKLVQGRWRTNANGYHFYKKSFVIWDRHIGYVPTAYTRTHVKYKVVGKYSYKLHFYDIRSDRYFTTGTLRYINPRTIKVGSVFAYKF